MPATLNAIARQRKQQLRLLMEASKKLDAAQESLEREIKRLVNRKRSVPELADATRLIQLAKTTEASLGNMVQVCEQMSKAWGMEYA